MANREATRTLSKTAPAPAAWKQAATWNPAGYFDFQTPETGAVPIRLFLSPALLAAADDNLYPQIVTATHFPGVKLVILTPDVHVGYSVPVGSVILTDGTLAMGPVGYDIGCGMISARSTVPAGAASRARRLAFNQAVMERVAMGTGGTSKTIGRIGDQEFEALVRGGADYYLTRYGGTVDRSQAERNCIPVDDDWPIPWGGKGRPERGRAQLGSLGGGNHFIELQRCTETGTLFIQVHSGSRGFGHGLATNYFDLARRAKTGGPAHIDQSYVTPDSPHYRGYLNAVAAGGNFAIVNRLILFQQIAAAFREVFAAELEVVYEISHNLVQREWHPDYGEVWVHRKGATRAFPAAHPALVGTPWADRGHPILIPGSNRDYSFILRPCPGAVRSGYSVNHGAGRRLGRNEARGRLSQPVVDRQYRESGVVVNADGHVPLDESDACYKSATEVVDVVVAAGLAEIEYRLWPLASLKGAD